MAGLAMILFIALFAFGGQYFGWTDTTGHIHVALFVSFGFGMVCGFRFRNS